MQQLKLFDDDPNSAGKKSFPTENRYQPDWEVEQDNAPLEGDKIIWNNGDEEIKATVVKVYKRGDKVKILTNKFVYLIVSLWEITVCTPTLVNTVGNEEAANLFPTQKSVGNEEAAQLFPAQKTVGNKNLFPAQKTGPNEEAAKLSPTDFYKAAQEWDLEALHDVVYFLQGLIRKRGEALTVVKDSEVPQLYIEAKKFPYTNKHGVTTWRGPYYYLRGETSKKSSKWLASKFERIPDQYKELPIYGEDIPF